MTLRLQNNLTLNGPDEEEDVVTNQGFGVSVVYRVVMFDEGVIIEEGAPDKLFHRAEQERTRRFLNQLHWHGE